MFDFLIAYIEGRQTLEQAICIPGNWIWRRADRTAKQRAHAMMDAGCRWYTCGDSTTHHHLNRVWRETYTDDTNVVEFLYKKKTSCA